MRNRNRGEKTLNSSRKARGSDAASVTHYGLVCRPLRGYLHFFSFNALRRSSNPSLTQDATPARLCPTAGTPSTGLRLGPRTGLATPVRPQGVAALVAGEARRTACLQALSVAASVRAYGSPFQSPPSPRRARASHRPTDDAGGPRERSARNAHAQALKPAERRAPVQAGMQTGRAARRAASAAAAEGRCPSPTTGGRRAPLCLGLRDNMNSIHPR
jgi:hypothetical protein